MFDISTISSLMFVVLVQVVLQPVEFVYSPTFIERASSFFCFPASQDDLNEQVSLASDPHASIDYTM